jgi:hypothetical protein
MIAAYVEGEVTRSEGAAVEAQLAESPVARRTVARLREIAEGLAAPVPELERVDLVIPWSREATARGRGWSFVARPGMYAIAVAALVVLSVAVRKPASDEFRAKSAEPGERRGRWAGIRVYRVDASGKASPLGRGMRATDGLLFSYSNLGPLPFEHLMIFGVDAQHEVRWFYPAYDEEGTNPASIPIEKGDAEVALPDVVHHDLAPGPFAIHALFSQEPLHVLDVEARVREQPDPTEKLSFKDATEQIIMAMIAP